MIFAPRTEAEHTCLRTLLLSKEVSVEAKAHILAWITKDNVLVWIVAFDQWNGRTCQIHWAALQTGYMPREMLRACFTHAFITHKLLRLFGIVNSSNNSAIRADLWMGFREVYRAEGCGRNCSDLIFFEMRADECRWIRDQNG